MVTVVVVGDAMGLPGKTGDGGVESPLTRRGNLGPGGWKEREDSFRDLKPTEKPRNQAEGDVRGGW